jgi:transcriptional regulator with XRE-family HTH domain
MGRRWGVARRTDNVRARFGARVRELRNERGLSQEALAAEIGIHRTYLGGIELGLRNPALENIARLARALRVNIRDLFEGV